MLLNSHITADATEELHLHHFSTNSVAGLFADVTFGHYTAETEK